MCTGLSECVRVRVRVRVYEQRSSRVEPSQISLQFELLADLFLVIVIAIVIVWHSSVLSCLVSCFCIHSKSGDMAAYSRQQGDSSLNHVNGPFS